MAKLSLREVTFLRTCIFVLINLTAFLFLTCGVKSLTNGYNVSCCRVIHLIVIAVLFIVFLEMVLNTLYGWKIFYAQKQRSTLNIVWMREEVWRAGIVCGRLGLNDLWWNVNESTFFIIQQQWHNIYSLFLRKYWRKSAKIKKVNSINRYK